MVPKSLFTELSLKHPSGDYFLRPAPLLGAFYLDPKRPPSIAESDATRFEKVPLSRSTRRS